MSMDKEVAPSYLKKIAGVLLTLLVVSLPVFAQQQAAAPPSSTSTESAPKYEFFAGYSWYDPRGYYAGNQEGTAFKAPSIIPGFGVAATRNFGTVLGFTIDYS